MNSKSAYIAATRETVPAASRDSIQRVEANAIASQRQIAQRRHWQGIFGGAARLAHRSNDTVGTVTQCVVQCASKEEEEEILPPSSVTASSVSQKVEAGTGTAQAYGRAVPANATAIVQRVREESNGAEPNRTGMPDGLKRGVESLSGMAMDDVRVHYNSSEPSRLNALAYAQGRDIFVGAGQERHVPHEAWHVVQQAQGRVQPTLQHKLGVPVNDDVGLEQEADRMGAAALDAGNRSSVL